MLASFATQAKAATAPYCQASMTNVRVAQASHDAAARPATDWQNVQLPDFWSARWPDYSGGAWYQIQWYVSCNHTPPIQALTALSIDHISMAGAVYVNDDLLWQDRHLAEPLSRSWNMPRYWILPASSIKPGNNTLWIYVVGVSGQLPGLGKVMLGTPDVVYPHYQAKNWQMRQLFLINVILSATLGLISLLVWLLYRKESAFGWYGAASLFWCLFISSILTTETAPWQDSLMFARISISFFMMFVPLFCLFSWRFANQRFRTYEVCMVTTTLWLLLILWMAPASMIDKVIAFCWFGYVGLYLFNCFHYQYPLCIWIKKEVSYSNI